MSYPKIEIGELVVLRQGFAINKNTKHHISDHPTNLALLRIADMKEHIQCVFVKDSIPAHFIAKKEVFLFKNDQTAIFIFYLLVNFSFLLDKGRKIE